jgi:hypothetical protein
MSLFMERAILDQCFGINIFYAKRNTNVTDKILETLASPDVLDKIVPVLAEKIGEALTPLIEDEIKKCPYIFLSPGHLYLQDELSDHGYLQALGHYGI